MRSCMVMLTILWSCLWNITHVFARINLEHNKYLTNIDKDVQYAVLHPFQEEWSELMYDTAKEFYVPSPFHFWFRCINNQVRGYLFPEDLRPMTHEKEAIVPPAHILQATMKMFANGRKIPFRSWRGGLDFYFNVTDAEMGSFLRITIKGLKHYTYFDSSKCVKHTPSFAITDGSEKRPKYVMHIHLRQFYNSSFGLRKTAEGIAKHAYYHRCALHLDRYEFVVHREQVTALMNHEGIKRAVEDGWMRIIIRNPVIPTPIKIPKQPTDCYWQAYVENMALLRYWKENVRIYFWDSDEYMWFPDTYSSKQYLEDIQKHSMIGFDRFMTFCATCPDRFPELRHFSLRNTSYKIVAEKLMHPKLLVDPNVAGCFIVHWGGCGTSEPYSFPEKQAHILHFENLYLARWEYNNKMIQTAVPLTPSKVNLVCDPQYRSKTVVPMY